MSSSCIADGMLSPEAQRRSDPSTDRICTRAADVLGVTLRAETLKK